jgi:hypothetical protein
VAKVEVLVATERPSHRIVHIRDWHYVPRELYAADLRSSSKTDLSDEAIEMRHRELLLEVEFVQLEQVALLRCLARRHALRRVRQEGLTPEGVEAFRGAVGVIRDALTRRPELLNQQHEVRGMLPRMEAEGKQDTDRYRRTVAAGREVAELLARLALLELGAGARLMAAGEYSGIGVRAARTDHTGHGAKARISASRMRCHSPAGSGHWPVGMGSVNSGRLSPCASGIVSHGSR